MKKTQDPIGLSDSEFGVLRAFQGSQHDYLKKHPELFFYLGDKLFHYTDLNGLMGILSNKGFWLSDARYLNDAEEIKNGMNLALNVIEKLSSKKSYSKFLHIFEEVHQSLKTTVFDNIHYICSFTTRPDTLEHWRSYGKNGSGICIGFDLKQQTEYPHFQLPPSYTLRNVIYDDKIKTRMLLSIILRYKKEFLQDLKDKPQRDYSDDYIEHLTFSLSHLFINFKHYAFHTEQEVRLVDSLKKGEVSFYNKKYHRVSNEMIVPYVCTYNTKLKKGPSGDAHIPDNLPVSKIVVGPNAKQESTIESIKDFLSDIGYRSKIEIIKSKVPFRG